MTAKPMRMQLSRAKGFNLQQASIALNGLAAVNAARPGPWGNPFIVGEDGSREKCIQMFRDLLNANPQFSKVDRLEAQEEFVRHAAAHWKSLKGKNLACWCAPDAKCHADVLLELANRCAA
jgi:hypothetical protein